MQYDLCVISNKVTMGRVWFFLSLWFGLSFGQQYYDSSLCFSDKSYPGTRYTCSLSQQPCSTFFVYRSKNQLATVADISDLFNLNSDTLLSANNVNTSGQVLEPGHEVLVPIKCSNAGNGFSQVNFTYTVPENTTLSSISCEVFQGLVKSVTLAEESNLLLQAIVPAGTVLRVPIKCACPDDQSTRDGVKYLVTYPFIKRDDTKKVSEKFNVSEVDIWKANHLDPTTTLYPATTILVPLKDKPFINFEIPDSDPPKPQFLPTIPIQKAHKFSQLNKAYIAGSVVTFALIVALLVACCLYIKALKKFKAEKIRSRTHRISSLNSCSTPAFSDPPTRSSTNSCLSPDLLVGIKYSLCTYTVEDLRRATSNFSQDSEISSGLHRGVMIDHGEVMIKRTRFEGTRQVIDVHSKINHVNIVKLHGVCYGGEDIYNTKWSYLVFEHPVNGNLRDCLAGASSVFNWHRRTQVAFDIAMGLHYLHYSVIPGYTHLNLSSKSIFLTSSWRAKVTVFGTTKSCESLTSWIAPEHVAQGVVSANVDIFAFGVVLLELISGKDAAGDGELLRESIMFLGGGGNEVGCFDHLRSFVDPCLKDDYPIAEALCLSVLAGSCVEDDPMHRPTMDDVLKILARMV